MDVADLRTFQAVAEQGGMNRAAAVLNTVQSNVTQRVRALEDELGCPLFERHSRGVALTAAGRRLLPYARRIADLVAEAARAAREDGSPKGALVLGSLETTAALRLTPILAKFVAAYPEVDVALRTGTTAEMVAAVLARTVEGAFVCGPIEHPEIAAEPVFREELAVVTAPGVRSLAAALGSGDVRIVVLRAGCSYRQRLEEALARRGIAAPRILEFGTLEAIFRCVGAGLGITLLPRSLIGRVWEAGLVAVHTLPEREGRVETLFIRRGDGYVSGALAAFLRHVRGGASGARSRRNLATSAGPAPRGP